ncbi:MAG: hypothetical protein J0L66_02050 [Cytophagales bacterium]|nr:hypothetical protein [Cytophagales bacterium]
MKLKPFSIILIGLLLGCQEDDIRLARLFTLKVDRSYLTESTDNWIVVHDEDGKVLEFKSFESGDELIIETQKSLNNSNTLGVTIINYYHTPSPFQSNYQIETYFDYPIGSQMTLEQIAATEDPVGDLIGTFDVRLTSLGYLDTYSLTNKYGRTCGGSGSTNEYNSEINFQCSIEDIAKDYILIASDNQGNLRHQRLEDVQNGSNFEIDFRNMQNFDEYFEFNFPQSSNVFVIVEGQEIGQLSVNGYTLQYHFQSDTHNKVKVGYLNSLTNYSTWFSSAPYTYFNKGSKPDPNFSFPALDEFSVQNKKIEEFTSTAANDFVYRKSFFVYRDPTNSKLIVNWTVNSSSHNHLLEQLPDEILEIHPLLNFHNLVYSRTQFIFGTRVYPPVTPADPNLNYVEYTVLVTN